MPSLKFIRALARRNDDDFGERLAADLGETMQTAFPPRTRLERKRDEAQEERDEAITERGRLETALSDLDATYQRNRAALVQELSEAGIVLEAAEARVSVLDAPQSMPMQLKEAAE